jgi:hypothetical protein
MKTIRLELSKELSEKWLLDDIETEYYFYKNPNWEYAIIYYPDDPEWINGYKALNLEEAIEFIWKNMCQMKLLYPNAWKWIMDLQFAEDNIKWNSLIEVFEQFIEYLLTEWMIWKQ